jgi:hypothetical protein
MSNFQLKDVPRWFFIKSQNSYLIMLLYWRKQQFVHCWKIRAIFVQNTLYFAEFLRKFYQCKSENKPGTTSFIHVGLFLLTQDTNAEHLLNENSTWKRRYF